MDKGSLDQALFLINPSRFPGFTRRLRRILKYISAPNILECRSAEEFSAAVQEFAAGNLRFLLIWGGDGTANLAINSYMNSPVKNSRHQALGFLRGGSGNGIQDSYEVPVGISAQIEAYREGIRNDYTQPVDLIKVSDGDKSTYCQLLGTGIDSRVLEYREGAGGGRPGMVNYFLAIGRTVFKDFHQLRGRKTLIMQQGKYAFKGTRTNAEFPFDEFRRTTRSPLIEFGTRPYYAKMFKIAPDVVCNDGAFDIYNYNFQRRTAMLLNIISIWNGWHSRINRQQARKERPVIERYEVARARIEMDHPFSYHLDGELKRCIVPSDQGIYSIKAEIVPSSVNFIVPGSFYHKFHPFREM